MQPERSSTPSVEARVQPAGGGPPGYDDEVRLVDILKIFYRQRRWMVAVFVIVLAAGAVYYLLAPRKYEVAMSMVIPLDEEHKPLERADDVEGRVRAVYAPETRPDSPAAPMPERIEFRDVGTQVVSMSITVGEPNIPLVSEWFDAIGRKVTGDWQRMRKSRSESARLEQESLRARIARLNAALDGLYRERSTIRDATRQNDLDTQISLIKQDQAETAAKAQQLGVTVAMLEQPPTMRHPTPSDLPVAPRLKLVVVLAFVGGAVLAVLVALLRDFWIRNRDELRAEAP